MIHASKSKFFQPLWLLLSLLLICCLSACGGSTDSGSSGGGSTTPSAANINLIASPPTVQTNDSSNSTITITALNSLNAALSGITITLGTDTGVLSAPNVTTDSTGSANVTFLYDGNPINRTATITATSGSVTSKIPVGIVGSTVSLASDASSISVGSAANLTVTAKDAGGNLVDGAAVTLTTTGTGNVTIAKATGTTTSGVFTTTASGVSVGDVSIIARALGASATKSLTVAVPVDTFAIDDQLLDGHDIGNPRPSAMQIGQDLTIYVNVPPSIANVTFTTSYGSWVGVTDNWIQVLPTGVSPNRKASATLNTDAVTSANVTVCDTAHISTNDTLLVYMTSNATPYSIILQASPTVVPVNTGTSTITATVRNSSNPAVPIANVPIAFSIVNPTGGGETILPVIAQTAINGQASTTFTAGSLTSYDAGGVKIHAEVIGTAAPIVETGVSPSGNDASIVIGGLAGSIAFGQATVISVDSTQANYIWPMSILVSDVNGNAVSGTTVSLSVWPIAWSTGTACSYDNDNGTNKGTFLNEDVNENLIKDNYNNPYWSGNPPPYDEDGLRRYYASGNYASNHGTPNGSLTPANSDGGSVPATVKTDSTGVASFSLTYPKESAIWTLDRIRASTIVQGSETVGQIILRLECLDSDCGSTCLLGNSPYTF